MMEEGVLLYGEIEVPFSRVKFEILSRHHELHNFKRIESDREGVTYNKCDPPQCWSLSHFRSLLNRETPTSALNHPIILIDLHPSLFSSIKLHRHILSTTYAFHGRFNTVQLPIIIAKHKKTETELRIGQQSSRRI